MKPMLASDADLSKIKFPVMIQPKVDGVRGLVINGKLVGRSLKTHANRHVTDLFSQRQFEGFDGELFFGADPAAPDLCRTTTSAVNRIEQRPFITFAVFDWLHEDVRGLPYFQRLSQLFDYMGKGIDKRQYPIMMLPTRRVFTLDELEAADTAHLDWGYEGTIVRDPNGLHKQGRSTVREGGLLRIKRFVEEEALVIGLTEGQHNGNEAKTNELGRTERSSHQENMVPNGMVGNLLCRDLKTGMEITVAPGTMTHEDRRYNWENQDKVIGQIIKYKCFPIGVKEKPRFPTFQCFRAASDMG